MQDFMSKQQPIKLSDCKIMQESKTGQQNGGSIKSKHAHWWVTEKSEVSSVEFKDNTPSPVMLRKLQLVDTNKQVSVDVKVNKITET